MVREINERGCTAFGSGFPFSLHLEQVLKLPTGGSKQQWIKTASGLYGSTS
jgi:hypothetical protein